MLIDFRVSNHRSIQEEQVFTTVANGKLKDVADYRPRKIDGLKERLLPALAIYGANASGKTNLLSGLDFMSDAVVFSHRMWEPDSGIPRDPFAWGEAKQKESVFEADFLINRCRYQYGFSVDDESVLEEWLYWFPNGKKAKLFEREGQEFEYGDGLKGQTKIIEQITGNNALYLSAASQHRNEQLFPIYSWFRSINIYNLEMQRRRRRPPRLRARLGDILRQETGERSDEDNLLLNRFKKLLAASDFGINDVRREETDKKYLANYYLQHSVEDENPWLPLEEESNGTKTMFRLGIPVLEALTHGTILMIDELESSLHPLLAMELIKLFNDPNSNPKNSQLIFTTHDSNLLGTTISEPAVRRDQVYLTEKSENGATVIYPLTDFKPRKSENLERGYLQGRYGAIPFLGHFSNLGSE